MQAISTVYKMLKKLKDFFLLQKKIKGLADSFSRLMDNPVVIENFDRALRFKSFVTLSSL